MGQSNPDWIPDTMSNAPASDRDNTQPSIHLGFDPKVYGLLVEEEQARTELLVNIDKLLETVGISAYNPNNARELHNFLCTTEQTLIAVKDYMKGVKDMGDLIRQG